MTTLKKKAYVVTQLCHGNLRNHWEKRQKNSLKSLQIKRERGTSEKKRSGSD